MPTIIVIVILLYEGKIPPKVIVTSITSFSWLESNMWHCNCLTPWKSKQGDFLPSTTVYMLTFWCLDCWLEWEGHRVGLCDQNLHNPVWRLLVQLLCENAHLKEPPGTKTFLNLLWKDCRRLTRSFVQHDWWDTLAVWTYTGLLCKIGRFHNPIFPMIELGFWSCCTLGSLSKTF